MDKLQLRETILKQIERPHIPEREFPACMFGVAADSREVQTRALQLAIDTISREGGGRLMLPGGTIRTGALELKSRVELHLQHRTSTGPRGPLGISRPMPWAAPSGHSCIII